MKFLAAIALASADKYFCNKCAADLPSCSYQRIDACGLRRPTKLMALDADTDSCWNKCVLYHPAYICQ